MSLQRSPRPLAGFKGLTAKGVGEEGKRGETVSYTHLTLPTNREV